MFAAILGAMSFAAGCGSRSATPNRTPSSLATAAAAPTFEATELMVEYAAASAPFAQSELQYNSVLNSLPLTPSSRATDAASLNAANRPYAAALAQFDAALPNLPWTSSMLPYVQALLMDQAVLRNDLVVDVTPQNLVVWIKTTLADRTSAAKALQTLQEQPGVLAT